MKISVIVPSYNSAATIARTLDALLDQPAEYLQEIIVVDSSDDHKTKELLNRYSGRIRLVSLHEKTMPAVARNTGARMALGRTLAFIDSDAYCAPDWLTQIARARGLGCRVGGGAICLPEFQRRSALARAQYFLQFNEFMDSGQKRTVTFVPSCNLFCEKNLFQAAGGFPGIRASEDVLFGQAVSALSGVVFDPGIKVHHIFRTQLGAYLDNQRLLGRYIYLYRRMGRSKFFYSPWAAVPLLPFILAAKFLRITARVFKQPENIAPFLTALPLFMAGLFYWGIGFFGGCFQKGPAVLGARTVQKPAGTPVKQDRPWGRFEICGVEDGALIKRIEVFEGMRFSLQKHLKRSEKWVIVSGRALVTLGDRQWEAEAGSFVEIPVGEIHRIQNVGSGRLVFVEVQLGSTLEEDDIIRLEDDFGRVPRVSGAMVFETGRLSRSPNPVRRDGQEIPR